MYGLFQVSSFLVTQQVRGTWVGETLTVTKLCDFKGA